MDAVPFDVEEFLGESGRPAQLAAVSRSGRPLLGSLWFAFVDGRFWFSSAVTSPFVKVATRGGEVAVIVDQFHPPSAIRQVRIRGAAGIDGVDRAMVELIYRRYLGSDRETWPPYFRERVSDANWTLWSVAPDTGLVADFSDFGAREYRWTRRDRRPL